MSEGDPSEVTLTITLRISMTPFSITRSSTPSGVEGRVILLGSLRGTSARVDDDRSVLSAWQHGDTDAGHALVERHYESVLRFFRTKAGDHADDLVQQTFLRCLQSAERYRGESSFKSFLFGIARNVLFEHIREKTRDGNAPVDFGVSSILDLSPRASTLLFQRAAERALVQALQDMPVEIQIALELFYWEELSVEEIASAVETPPGTVKSRLHRGRTLLRKTLAELADPELARWSKSPDE